MASNIHQTKYEKTFHIIVCDPGKNPSKQHLHCEDLTKWFSLIKRNQRHTKIWSWKNVRHRDAQICPVWHSVQHLKRNYSNTKELPCEWCSCTISAYVALHFYQDDKHKPAWESRCLFPPNLLNISISQQLTACDNDQSTETFWFGSKLFTQKQLFVVYFKPGSFDPDFIIWQII